MDIFQFVIFWIIFIFLASIPIDFLLNWITNKVRDIESKLDRKTPNIRLSKAGFIYLLIKVLQFSKGYFSVYFTQYFFGTNYLLLMIAVGGVIIIHNWSWFNKFKNRHRLLIIAWGIYTAINPLFFLILPLSYLLLSFLFNSFVLGIMANIIFMFALIWFLNLDAIYVMVNLIIFIAGFLVYLKLLFKHFEEKPYTILRSFENRG